MRQGKQLRWRLQVGAVLLAVLLFILVPFTSSARADVSVPQTDRNPATPLAAGGPSIYPRYISGFGTDNTFTIFYEDRNDAVSCPTPGTWRIYFNQTTSGPLGLSPTSTATYLCETHFTVKNWPITLSGTTYAYRGWGANGNTGTHAFYVSTDLVHWTLVSTFTFNHPSDGILYGFHDILMLNGHSMGFVESAGGRTYIVWSAAGDQNWTVVAEVGGGGPGDGPLNLYLFSGITGPKPTGNFIRMYVNGSLVFGKLMIPGDSSAAYLAINGAAAQAATPAEAETAFLDPANWTWQDLTTRLPSAGNAVLTRTIQRDINSNWIVPMSDPGADFVILYSAEYISGTPAGLGCAAQSTQCLVVLPAPSPTPTPTSTPTPLPNSGPRLLIPATGFAPNRFHPLPVQPVEDANASTEIALEIPALGIQLPIFGVPQRDGKWDVSWLGNQAGYLEGTAFPTLPGNSAIAGHVTGADGKPGPFAGLARLSYGDEVDLLAWGYRYVFQVRENKLVAPEDASVFRHEDHTWVTLLTCHGYTAATDTYKYRRVVRAVLVRIMTER